MSNLPEKYSAHEPAIKALIIYEDIHLAAKVNLTLHRAANRCDIAVQWNAKFWNIDVLKLQRADKTALTEAAGAHLIVFAGNFARSLPNWLQDLLEQWAAYWKVSAVTLAAIGDESAGLLAKSATPELAQFAKRHGFSFICEETIRSEDSVVFFEHCLRGHGQPVFLRNLIGPTSHDPWRGWGINE